MKKNGREKKKKEPKKKKWINTNLSLSALSFIFLEFQLDTSSSEYFSHRMKNAKEGQEEEIEK